MALVKCKECGTEVSTQAKTCAKCGAPVKMPIQKQALIGCAAIVWIFIVLAVIGAIMKPKSDSAATAADEPDRVSTVELETLLASYKGNELAADNSYKNNWIMTSGVVDDVKKDILDSPYVRLGTGKQFEIPALQCMLAKDQADRAASLSKGDRIRVKGRVSGLMGNVIARECSIE